MKRVKIPTIAGQLARYVFIVVLPLALFGASGLALSVSYNTTVEQRAIIMMTVLSYVAVVILVDLIAVARRRSVVKHRRRDVEATMQTTSEVVETKRLTSTRSLASPVFDALEKFDEGSTVLSEVGGRGWRIFDVGFKKYIHGRGGSKFNSSNIYYSVIQIHLPRKLPHLVFDARNVRGQQMRLSFDKDQKISLEGNFDEYFDTYFPAHYEIDILSIITPEVMEMLLQAAWYDIEIYGNTLRLYAPLLPAKSLPATLALGLAIRDKLKHNVVTYRDERVAAEVGRQTVHIYGQKIQSSFVLKSVLLCLLGLGLIGLGAAMVSAMMNDGFSSSTDEEDVYGGIVVLIMIGMGCLVGAGYKLQRGFEERGKRRNVSRRK
jgi:hypothetical protein